MGSEAAPLSAVPAHWELAAETIAVKIRWFGLLVGYVVVNVGQTGESHRAFLNALLALGTIYALVDTYYGLRGQVFLRRWPLIISLMESIFIGLLCFFHGGLESSFRYYYLLSLICCAIRYSSQTTYLTCAMHCASYGSLYLLLPPERRDPLALTLTLVVLGWVTWAGDAMSLLLKRVGDHLARLNDALRHNQADLEARIQERTRELQESQAHVLHQEKMAAFGLLAAGIAHEVGNPLTSISALVQMLQRRDCDAYTHDKLALVGGELKRIQTILRELVNFSRPAACERSRVAVGDILNEAMNIAKYYKRTKGRKIEAHIAEDLPIISCVRDQLVQAFLNLVLNAIDATEAGGSIELSAVRDGDEIVVEVRDNGSGIEAHHAGKLFQPYFTTKKQGTGLGLFVTRNLVAAYGGVVEFDSTAHGGTTFRVRLPLDTEPDVPAIADDEATLPISGREAS
jgi:two-component system, NtrC family, sensor kinase